MLKHGKITVDEVPAPLVDKGHVLVEVAYSLISAGTEISGVKAAEKSLIRKALEQPEKVQKVLDYFKKHGLRKTVQVVRGKLSESAPLGYSCSGIVIGVGEEVDGFRIGDKVACAGAGKANHAEIVLVPKNLVVKVPEGCDLKDAASVAIGSIAMQGVRRADPRLGEIIAVIGLGLLGQITVQLLKAAGCRVVGFDIDRRRVELAKKLGADYSFLVSEVNYQNEILYITGGHGVDATIITAASRSDEIVQQAMEITRKKGRVVVVGGVGLGLKRSPFYEKEIDFLISCSYGPGRYDTVYEEKGLDYPYAYVRWTERRNMEEYLRLLAEGKVDFKAILDREYHISEAPKAYEELKRSEDRPIGVVLRYDVDEGKREEKLDTKIVLKKGKGRGDRINVALVGAGNFAKSVHLPNLKKLSDLYHLRAIVSATGSNARDTAERFGADYCTTNLEDVLADDSVDMVLIATRPNLHVTQAIESLRAGKAVFLEKPMAVDEEGLEELSKVLRETGVPFMVGFNRRFSPVARRLKELLKDRGNPLMVLYRVKTAYLPPDHWAHTDEGGGRIINEACHMFDFFNFIMHPSEAIQISATAAISNTGHPPVTDNAVATVRYRDGSVCNLVYTSIGSDELPKEYVEIHVDGKTFVIDDYRELRVYGAKLKGYRSNHQDKGHLEELRVFAKYVKGEIEAPIPLEDMISATRLSIIANRIMISQGSEVLEG